MNKKHSMLRINASQFIASLSQAQMLFEAQSEGSKKNTVKIHRKHAV